MPYNQDMIGNATDAALALSDWDTGMLDYLFSDYGCSRQVFLINGVIYKVGRDASGDHTNKQEYARISTDWHNLPTGVFYPKTDLFFVTDRFGADRPVIAQALVTGIAMADCYCSLTDGECDETCLPQDIYELVSGHMENTAGFNVIVNDESIFIVDPC